MRSYPVVCPACMTENLWSFTALPTAYVSGHMICRHCGRMIMFNTSAITKHIEQEGE